MKLPKGPLSLSGLALVLFSSGCAQQRVVEPIKPPVERLSCMVEPPVPSVLTDATVASYIVDLVEAGRDCRSQLQFVREFYGAL